MSRRSQLFVGRLPLDSREREVESIFDRYGSLVRCNLKYGTGMAYAFVDYEDKRDAEDAIKYENGRELRGQTIVVEWCRGPSSRPPMRGRTGTECYRCHRHGHWARDCPELERDRYKVRRYSRSRSPSKRRGRYSNSRSRSPSRGRYNRRRRTPSQARSPSYNRSKKPKKRTPSSSRSRSRSVEKSKKSSRRSYSKSASRSVTPDRKRNKSKSKDRSRSPLKSRSPSREKSESGQRRGRVSRSRSRSADRQFKSRSRSPNDNMDAANGDRKGTFRSSSRSRSKSPMRSRSIDNAERDSRDKWSKSP